MVQFTKNKILLFALFVFVITVAPQSQAQATSSQKNWVGTWAASQQVPEPHNSLTPEELKDSTLRQIVHLSIGGAILRIHLSNAFGSEPLHFTSVHIAQPLSTDSPKITPSTDRAVTFSGRQDVVIPAGAEYISDPVNYPVAALSNLAISFHLNTPPAQETGHPGSRTTSYLVHGDMVSAEDLPNAQKIDHWYQISGVDVIAPANSYSIVLLGDSITDGHGATTNGNDRWSDVLAARLHSSNATSVIGVLNQGIGGNHLLTDGLGPNALARFDRDVLAQPGVRYLIVLEGVNDLGGLTREEEVPASDHELLVKRIIGAYEQIVSRAHAHGIKVAGATIMPYSGSGYYHPGASNEADRQAVNQWIRTAGHFDDVVDFDKTMGDPSHPDHLLAAYDCGDHLHPSPAGYRVMGESIPLSLFLH